MTWRYITWVILIIFTFAEWYYLSGCVKMDEAGNEISRRLDALYFSIVTFSTLGYGDLYPCCDWSKRIACIEVAVGYLMLAILIHLIVKKLKIE